jgi:signal transduction histidine kinase
MVDDLVLRLRDAAVSVSSGLELDKVLQRVVDAAATLLDARYAALGVLGTGGDERLSEFLTTGFECDGGGHPEGRGILGLLISDATPLRLPDLTAHPQSYGFPEGHPPMRSFVGVPIRVRDTVYGNLYITEKHSGEFSDADEQLAIALAAMAGAAIENAFLYGATRRREQSLDAIREISGEILSGYSVGRVIELIADRARELVDADLAVICVPQSDAPDSDLEVRAVSSSAETTVVPGTTVSAQDSFAGAVMRRRRLIATADWVPEELAPAMAATPGNTAMGVPLLVRGQPFGALTLAVKRFGDEQRKLTETFANHASLMLDYTRTKHELDRLLLVEERERIGRDLHDTVIQRLFAAGLELQALAARHGQKDPQLAVRLGAAVDGLDATISQIRATIFALQPPDLTDDGTNVVEAARIHKLVADVVDESARVLGFMPDLLVPGNPERPVPHDIAAHMLGVVREALTNVARHASASSVVVEIESGDEFVVRVSDDGVGLPDDLPSGGHGLRNMRERARAVGGQLVTGAGPDGGTVIEWRVDARQN